VGYVGPMDPIVWTARPELRDPVLVAAFGGWNDAGEAASAAVGFLIDAFEAEEIAHVDPEEFFDFSAVRPTIRLTEGRTRELEWPQNTLHAAQIPGAERDLVLLQGVEPSLRWRTFTDAIVDAVDQLGVRLVVTLGALLSDIPHSRPTTITGIASQETLVERLGFQRSSYEGPTGVVGVLHSACARADLPSASLWASVPHYVAATPNPKAALALVRSFEGVAGVVVDATDLEEAAADYERQVNAAVASDPDVKAFVERLEQSLDESDVPVWPEQRLPSGDTIAREFQRFLRQKTDDAE
jgi:predicted ATP-grasp superfamily ATP-dependent carboligase